MSTVEAAAGKAQAMVRDSVKTVIAASMVGTAIEFYDFYAYGTAAANYFPKVFFGDTTNPTVALLASLLTFAIAFIARPLGSLVFGHFGDRMGRKTTLVVSLLTMGIATFLIGCLPTYNQWGVAAVAVLCLCRFVQGIGLGGEWSGAALVATENAPEDKRALYGSFPELGAPIGFFLSNGTYFLLETFNDNDAMLAWGWRVPFLLSSILVIVGLVVRVQMEETPIFRMAQEQKKVVKSPLTEVFKKSWKEVIQATFLVAVTYTLFYTLATWSLAWGTKTVEQGGGNLGFTNQEYLLMLMIAVCVFAAFIAISCVNADKFTQARDHHLLLLPHRLRPAVPVPARSGGRRSAQLRHQPAVPVHRLRSDGYRVRSDRRLPAGTVRRERALLRLRHRLQPGCHRRRGLRADHRHLAVPSLGRAFRGPVPRCDGLVLPHRGVELQGNEERRLHQVTPTGLPGCFAWGGSEP